MDHAYPEDELNPVECKGRSRDSNPDNWFCRFTRGLNDVLGNFSLTLVDSMDTLALMGLRKEFEKSLRIVIDTLHFDLDSRVQVFEVTIRMLGGLLSSHLFATGSVDGHKVDWYEGQLLDLAVDLGNRLLPAFNTTYGLPYPRVNLKHGVVPHEVKEACTAGAGTLVMEFGVLSRLTGNPVYEQVAKKALIEIFERRSKLNLVGNTMNLFDRKVIIIDLVG
jgi:mannosidase alpha-like ER degradation enhancer 1